MRLFGYPDFDTANIAAESWFKDPDRRVARNAALNLRRLAPSPNPAREEPPRIRIEYSAARPVCWLRLLSGLSSANLLGIFVRSPMVTRVIILAIIVLAIVPQTRPILFRTLGQHSPRIRRGAHGDMGYQFGFPTSPVVSAVAR